MLSKELMNLADRFDGHARTGVDVRYNAEDCKGVAAFFRGLADQAAALEGQPVPAHQRGDLPEGVVDLSQVRAHREFDGWLRGQMVPPYSPKGPGGAA